MKTVYLVQHEHIENDNIEDTRIVGIYSSEKLAHKGIERAKKLSGFRDVPEGFEIIKYVLDKDSWFVGYTGFD
jgi:homoserine kinase type II